MPSPLHMALRDELEMSDAEFARLCGRHRTEIWAYRTGRRDPRGRTALAILEALRKLGVKSLTIDDLFSARSKRAA